jgi:hypothetical protein
MADFDDDLFLPKHPDHQPGGQRKMEAVIDAIRNTAVIGL